MEQTNQTSEVDVVVPALCAFLLGICYEFNREPGEITRFVAPCFQVTVGPELRTRGTIRPLLDRLGVDRLVGRMSRLREDERFKSVGPDSIVLPYPTPANAQIGLRPEGTDEGEIWFDWAFVDFWKSNYCQLTLYCDLRVICESNIAIRGQTQYKEGFQMTQSLWRHLQARMQNPQCSLRHCERSYITSHERLNLCRQK